MTKSHTITLIPGDGIGPEISTAVRKIIDATGVKIDWELCEAGASVFKKGLATGVPNETIDSIARNKIAMKAPLETPVGYGEKSANVTLRKMFETYGNIRPVLEFPGVVTPYQGRNIDFVIIRENVEDLYAGIEYAQSPGVAETLKLISRKGCEKIARLAFEFARSEGRKKVHCASKANIMKATEGLMKRTFEEVATDYPDIQSDHIIVDNCAHQMVRFPEEFDVIVTTNMNGDILSDLGSGLIGGLGFAPSSNIGDEFAIFEAVHGSAPKYAGLNKINPSAFLLSGTMMLRHLGEFDAARQIENALFKTVATDRIYTQDVSKENAVSTTAFTDAVIKNLGQEYVGYHHRPYKPINLPKVAKNPDLVKVKTRDVIGVDIYVESNQDVEKIGQSMIDAAASTKLQLKLITNRGVKVFPNDHDRLPDLVDCFACRFVAKSSGGSLEDNDIMQLIQNVSKNYRWNHIEKLNMFDGVAAFSKSHGED